MGVQPNYIAAREVIPISGGTLQRVVPVTKLFFVREETETQVVYRLRNAWVAFVAAWIALISTGVWWFAQPPFAKFGAIGLSVAGAVLGLRYICFLRVNLELLAAKNSGRMKIEGSKFSRKNPPVITLDKNVPPQKSPTHSR